MGHLVGPDSALPPRVSIRALSVASAGLVGRSGLTLGLVWAASCTPAAEPGSRPDVFLLVLDTLRADHLSAYGYGRPTSPNLDRFAEGATLYENAVSTAPWTLPSHGSLFTGLLPFQHGAHTQLAGGSVRPASLSTEPATLSELLGDSGYASLGFAANVAFLRPDYGLSRGFDAWVLRRAPASQLLPRVLSRYDELHEQDDAPVFLFANFLDTHRPYNAKGQPAFAERGDGQESVRWLDELYEPVLTGTEPADSDRLNRLRDLYDASIANLDAALGDFFTELHARDRYDSSLIAITSDHGEAFGEHALIEHSKDIYQALLHVPLIVKPPHAGPGVRDPRRVGLAQVPALLLEHLPLASQAAGPEHAALLNGPVLEGEPIVAAENFYSRARDYDSPRFGARFRRTRHVLFDEGWKWVGSSEGSPELYDLSQDPPESASLASSEAERTAALGARWARLRAEFQTFHSGGEVSETDETRRALGELGYY